MFGKNRLIENNIKIDPITFRALPDSEFLILSNTVCCYSLEKEVELFGCELRRYTRIADVHVLPG